MLFFKLNVFLLEGVDSEDQYEAYLASFFFDGTGGMEISPPLKSLVLSQPMVFPSTSPVSWFPSRAT
jgi:hypothetical protein